LDEGDLLVRGLLGCDHAFVYGGNVIGFLLTDFATKAQAPRWSPASRDRSSDIDLELSVAWGYTALGSDGQGPKGFSFVFLDLF
jgi:hypothetical protein